MDEEDLFCFEEDQDKDDLFDFEQSKTEILQDYHTTENLDFLLVDAKLSLSDQNLVLEGRLGILASKVGFKTSDKSYLFQDQSRTRDIKKVGDEYYWNLELTTDTWIQFQLLSADAITIFPDLANNNTTIKPPEDEQDESTLIPMSRYEEKVQIAIETRDEAIRQANLEYEATLSKLNKEFKQDNNDICGLCCDSRCNVVIMPCLHKLCKACSSRIGMECPWDRAKVMSFKYLE